MTKVSKHTETRAKASEKGEKWDRLDAHTVPGGLGDVHTILVMLLKDPKYYYRCCAHLHALKNAPRANQHLVLPCGCCMHAVHAVHGEAVRVHSLISSLRVFACCHSSELYICTLSQHLARTEVQYCTCLGQSAVLLSRC